MLSAEKVLKKSSIFIYTKIDNTPYRVKLGPSSNINPVSINIHLWGLFLCDTLYATAILSRFITIDMEVTLLLLLFFFTFIYITHILFFREQSLEK